MTRRDLLRAGLVGGAVLLGESTLAPRAAHAQQPGRGGILRVRGYDPPHFDPLLAIAFKTSCTVSFVYNKLVRYKVGPDVRPGTFTVEPDLAERCDEPDDTTYVFHLRRGVRWHNKPPVNVKNYAPNTVFDYGNRASAAWIDR